MKKYLFSAFFVLLALVSCESIDIRVTPSQRFPAIRTNEPMMVYTSKQDLPDSSELVGEISTWVQGSRTMSDEQILIMIEDEVKRYGGNAIKFNPSTDDDKRSELFKGKVYRIKPFERLPVTYDSLKRYWKNNKADKFEGLYETDISYVSDKYIGKKITYACLKRDSGNYVLLYIDGYEQFKYPLWGFVNLKRVWRQGDVFASFNKTVNDNIFKCDILSLNKAPIQGSMFKFDNGNLRLYNSQGLEIFQKVYPDSSELEVFNASLTGFAINRNRVITCYHGVSDKDIKVFIKGINKQFDKKYEAVVEKFDKLNDIAILKLVDSTVSFGDNPFTLAEDDKGIAEDIFVLGYPMSLLMGDEIKLTNGIISSRSGFAGDLSAYQISAPVQPGNSGAPLFDKKGMLIGMINSKIMDADNVAYSIKARHLNEFLVKSGYVNTFGSAANLSGLSLSEQVKSLQNSIYIIEVMDIGERYKQKLKNTKKRKWSNYEYDYDDE